MTKSFEELPDYINKQASEWFALINSGDAKAEDQMQLNAWLSENPEHRQAYQQIEAIWHILGEKSALSEVAALQESVQDNWLAARMEWTFLSAINSVRRVLSLKNTKVLNYAFAVTFLFVTAAGLLQVQQSTQLTENFYATDIGQIQTLSLADGSEVTLGAKSKIKISIDRLERKAELLYGEAFFDIASDKSRSFRVLADKVAIQVVGTQFNVLKRSNSVNVSVLEGQVNVSNQEALGYRKKSDSFVSLTAGQQLVKVDNERFDQVEAVKISDLAVWRTGRLIFNETALIDVISDASRYFEGKFSMQSEELANQKVTMSLRTDQINQLPQMLAQVLPIEYRQIPGNIIVFENTSIN